MPKSSTGVAVLAAGAASTWFATNAFLSAPPASQPPASTSLRGASGAVDTQIDAAVSSTSVSPAGMGALLIGASAVAAATAKPKSKTRLARCADPAGGAATMPEEEVEMWDPAKQIGATAPFGYWDPAGIMTKYDENGFRALRACEIKHGRVAMMASIGAVGQHFLRFPGFEKAPAGLKAAATEPGIYGLIALTVVSGIFELGLWKDDDREAGNFGDPFGVNQYTEDMRNRELNNGRAAMIATLGIVVAEICTGKDGVQQLGF